MRFVLGGGEYFDAIGANGDPENRVCNRDPYKYVAYVFRMRSLSGIFTSSTAAFFPFCLFGFPGFGFSASGSGSALLAISSEGGNSGSGSSWGSGSGVSSGSATVCTFLGYLRQNRVILERQTNGENRKGQGHRSGSPFLKGELNRFGVE